MFLQKEMLKNSVGSLDFPDARERGVVGNGGLPLLAQRIFESCLRSLKETDGVSVERDVIEID